MDINAWTALLAATIVAGTPFCSRPLENCWRKGQGYLTWE